MATVEASSEAMATVADKAPLTAQRKVPDDLETKLPKPYMPRALTAPNTENANGTWGHKHNDMSVLQQHAAFFDLDKDGIIYPLETYRGLRAIGFNVISSFIFMIIIHAALSYLTLPTWLPSPWFPIYIQNIHRAKHGGSSQQIWKSCSANMPVKAASKFEWGVLYLLARDEQGFLSKEAVRRCFDGSLFEYCAKVRKGTAGKMA
ncbi:Caleosin-related [Sesbania bispinosa]|nr:Caleosin-related [Sesbania bispinosa]